MKSLFCCAASVCVLFSSMEASATKKYVFAGWDLGDVTPQEILDNADKFGKSGCDGVTVALGSVMPSACGDVRRALHVAEMPRWRDEDIGAMKPVLREFARCRGLSHSFFRINLAPRKARIPWTDDAAWALYADNVAMTAELAKEVGFPGIVADFEDYWRRKQFRHAPDDPSWSETKKLARMRARDTFGRVFAAYPDIVILTFQLLTTDTAYARKADPVAHMEAKRDLWPSFVNGILDAMPPSAKIVDGNESFAYAAKASKLDFYRSVRDQTIGVLPLVDECNRVKYRSQLSVGFGLYLDSYDRCPTNSAYYMGPVRGRRITHFEDNLRQATACSDEYVWFWGEKGFYVDWPIDLKEKSGDRWRSSGGGTWRRKYFEGSWGRIKPWRDTLDGDVDLLLRGVRNPAECVREEYVRQKSDGTFRDLFMKELTPLENATNGNVLARIRSVDVDGWYGMKVQGRGESLCGDAYFQHRGSWRWNLGSVQFDFGPESRDGDGWREGVALVRVPDGANDLFVMLKAGKDALDKVRRVEFRNLEVFRLK